MGTVLHLSTLQRDVAPGLRRQALDCCQCRGDDPPFAGAAKSCRYPSGAHGCHCGRVTCSPLARFGPMKRAAGAQVFIWFEMHVDRFRRAHRGTLVLPDQPVVCLLSVSVIGAICLPFYSCLRLWVPISLWKYLSSLDVPNSYVPYATTRCTTK